MNSPKITDYKILVCANVDELERLVKTFVNAGWSTSGGVCFNIRDNAVQAMVKYEVPTRSFTGPR